ncbi:terpene synthase family protein [Streptomyces chattanoogensis]
MILDRAVLGALKAWAHGLAIEEDHLVSGLTMAHYVRDGGEGHGRRAEGLGGGHELLFPLSADLAFLTWVNDYIERGEPALPAGSALDDHVRRLADVVMPGSEPPDEERSWWYDTLHAACAATRPATSPAVREWSYAEYLDNGVDSINVPHILATISLLCGYGIAARRAEPDVAAAIRVLGIQQRLSNDLVSAAKERLSGDPGNAVLLTERWLGPVQAARFVAAELRGHHRLLVSILGRLPAADPVVAAVDSVAAGFEEAQHDLPRYSVGMSSTAFH